MTIETIATNDLDEFWEKISPIGSLVESIQGAIFRGQASQSWGLTPAIDRENIYQKYSWGSSGVNYVNKLLLNDWLILREFIQNLDNIGYLIPNDSLEFRRRIEDGIWDDFSRDATLWPTREYYPLLALAQHHGIPTCLLDWTKSPIVGAYFAVSQWLHAGCVNDSDALALWALPSSDFLLFKNVVELINLPGSTSLNIAAQKGCFTVFRGKYPRGRNDLVNFELLGKQFERIVSEDEAFKAYKITIPSKFAFDLYERCNKYGVSGASLFPGVDGAARAALEAKLIDKLWKCRS